MSVGDLPHLMGVQSGTGEPLELPWSDADRVAKNGCEVRLVLKANVKRNIYEPRYAPLEQLLGAVNSFVEDELMRCQPGVAFEELGKMRFAHPHQVRQFAD